MAELRALHLLSGRRDSLALRRFLWTLPILATILVGTTASASADLTLATPAPKPPPFYIQLENLTTRFFPDRHTADHNGRDSVTVADFSIAVAGALKVPPPNGAAPLGPAHSYYKAVSSLLSLYDIAVERAMRPLAASLAAHFPHANIRADSPSLRFIPIDRETAAMIAYSAAYQQHVLPEAAPPPPEPPAFADEKSIRPGPVLRACHGAADQRLIRVGADNRFYPHHWLTWTEFASLIKLLEDYRKQARG